MTIEQALIDALGGHLNIVEIEPCTMRIRVEGKLSAQLMRLRYAWTAFWLSCAPVTSFKLSAGLPPTMSQAR